MDGTQSHSNNNQQQQQHHQQEQQQQQHHHQHYDPRFGHQHAHMHQPAAAIGYHIDPNTWAELQHQHAAAMAAYQQQQHMYPYNYHFPVQHPPVMEPGVPLPPGIPGLGGSTDPLEAVLGPFPCARLSNLPYDATLEDILVLFQGLVVIDVVLVGQDAFVIFANPMDFQMALQRDRQTIGRRFIEISPSSRAAYYQAIADQHLREHQDRKMGDAHHGVAGVAGVAAVGGDVVDKHSGDTTAAAASALWGSGAPPAAVPPPQHTPVQGLSSHATPTPTGFEPISMAAPMPPRLPPGAGAGLASLGGSTSSGGSRSGSGRSGAGGGGGGGGGGGLHAPLQKRTGGGIQVGEHTGFLRMRGLPFSASKEEILKFFGGYNPVPESIVLTYRNDGRATGEAYVGFLSPDDSKRAMELHRRTMGSRYIELFISNKDEQGRALTRFGNR